MNELFPTSRNDTPPWFRSWRVLTVGGVVIAICGIGIAAMLVDSGATPPSVPRGAASSVPVANSPAPTEPLTNACNDASSSGLANPPDDAVVVDTSDKLDELTASNPPGTLFWLASGVHTLGLEEFGQVIPKDGNTYVGAPGAVLDGQRANRYAFTGHARGVTIKHLTIENFGPRGTNNNQGVVNHDSAADWVIEGNTIRSNAGAAIMVGSGNAIRDNCLTENGQYGFSAYHPDGVQDIAIVGNEISRNNTDDWETRQPGCGCTGGGKLWNVNGAVFRDNWVHHNAGVGLWADTNNVGVAIERNYISENDAEGVVYETSYNALISANTFERNALVKGPTNPGFPASAVYISESGSDERVAGDFNEKFEVTGNLFIDNWSGVVLWENADRFSGSPANTSSGASTLVNPGVVTADSCNSANIDDEPYIDDCRWKTQNVHVHHNTFTFSPGGIGESCVADSGCGLNGIFSNWGTYPAWSPYHEDFVQETITFEQGNEFYNNTYSGPWHFVVHAQGNNVDWAAWQGAPYGQDADSVIKIHTPEEQ